MRLILLTVLTFFIAISPARAQVDITFYSHDFGKNFPHAFFTMKGSLENGETIDTSYGFTAVKISPAILWKSVTGEVQAPKQKYIDKSNPHFTITVDDEEYMKVMEVVTKWQNREQKSYSLKRRNCVHFTSEVIAILGYNFNEATKFWRKPKSFMLEVLELNPILVAIDYKKAKEEVKAANKEKQKQDKISRNDDKMSTDTDIMTTDEILRDNETDDANDAGRCHQKTLNSIKFHIINMPCHNRRSPAIRPPIFGNHPYLFIARSLC